MLFYYGKIKANRNVVCPVPLEVRRTKLEKMMINHALTVLRHVTYRALILTRASTS